MIVTGKIKNVVDFGAFVDLGIKETALLHISELSDTYVSDPMEVLKVGDIKECRIIGLDPDRRRISLSLKTQSSGGTAAARPKPDGHVKRVVAVKKAVPAGAKKPQPKERFSGSDDGMSYNPFAAYFNNKK